jgi:histidine triad (HIT) family protein
MADRDWYCEDVLSGDLVVETVWEDELVMAFHHPKPLSDMHIVVIPKTI